MATPCPNTSLHSAFAAASDSIRQKGGWRGANFPVYRSGAVHLGVRDSLSMLTIYEQRNGLLKRCEGNDPLAANVLWLDLLEPTEEERERLGEVLQFELPTRDDMQEIEMSSRLYHGDAGTFMTVTVLANSDTEQPVADVVSFILSRNKLITIRFIELQSFKTFR